MPSKTFSPSKRILAVQAPIIPSIADLIKQTPGTISLGQGVVYYTPPKRVFDKITPIDNRLECQIYSDVEGIPKLRSSIIDKLAQDNNIHIKQNQKLVVTAGANMGFINALMAITDPDDEIILLRPYYFNHEMAIQMLSCKTIPVDTDENYQPIIDNILSAITAKTKAIVTVSPNNPSGAVYPASVLSNINNLCLENGIYHISDEAYEYFTYDDTDHFSVASIPDSEPYTISLFSLSKAYGFAAWRIGYMIIPEHLFMSVKKVQDTNLICPTRVAQDAAIAALEEGKHYTLTHLQQINSVRESLKTALQSISNFCTTPDAKGAFYFFVKLNTPLSAMQVVEQLIKQHQIAIIPGETFGMTEGCYCRIAYGALDKSTSEQGIKRLIDGLKQIIK